MAGGPDQKLGMTGKTQIDDKSTLSPGQQMLSNALLSYTGQNLFGTPAQTTKDGVAYRNFFDALLGRNPVAIPGTSIPAVPGTLENPNVYPGQRVAYPSALQVQANNWAFDLPNRTQKYMDTAMQATSRASGPMDYSGLVGNAANLWNRTIMPSILNQQGGMDQAGGGGTTDALSRAGVDLASDLFAQITPLELQSRQQQLQGANQYAQIAQMPLASMGTMSAMGQQQRDITQQILEGERAKWGEAQPWANPMLSYAKELLPQSGQQMENIVSKETGMSGLFSLFS